MFCTVKLNSELALGTVVQFDSANQSWGTATSHSDMIGVVQQAPKQDDDGIWWAQVTFAGITHALASQAIPNEGGELNVSNGAVFVDNTADGCGIIAPLARGQETRNAGDLVMVHLR